MDRRNFIRNITLSVGMMTLPRLANSLSKSIRKKPNILFIFSDDHALRNISAYDGTVNKTPNIDSIAEQGAILLRSYCVNSICAPSRACILTGKHSHLNGVTLNSSQWNGKQVVFPRILKKNGYQTALIGKWHLNSNPGDEFNHWNILIGQGGQGHYYNPDFLGPDGKTNIEGYSTDIIADKAMKWMDEKRDPNKPFMLMCQFKAPHVHRNPSLKFINLYENETISEPSTLFDDHSNRAPYASKAWMKINGIPEFMLNIIPDKGAYDMKIRQYNFMSRLTEKQRSEWHKAYDPRNQKYRKLKKQGKMTGLVRDKYFYQRFIKDYLRCVAAIDDNVGRLLEYLKKKNLDDNTIVIYASDQGYYTGEHGWAEKRWMYEESLSMPFVIRWPGVIKPGTKVKEIIQNIDYAPFFLDAAGLRAPKEMQGRSFLPVLKGMTPDDWRKSIYYHYYAHGQHNVPRHYGVRTHRYKLINYYTENVWEFFDLEKDPHEIKSEYDNPEYKGKIEELKKEILRLREFYKVKG